MIKHELNIRVQSCTAGRNANEFPDSGNQSYHIKGSNPHEHSPGIRVLRPFIFIPTVTLLCKRGRRKAVHVIHNGIK